MIIYASYAAWCAAAAVLQNRCFCDSETLCVGRQSFWVDYVT